MQRLTKTQIEHFTTRVDELLSARAQAEKKLLGKKPKLLPYTFEQMTDLIRRGKAKLKPDVSQHTYLTTSFTYPESPQQKRAKMLRDRWDVQAAAIDKAIEAEKTRIIDQAILGDSETALQALTTLELKLAKA